MKNKLLFICAFLCISSGGIAQQLPSDGSYIDAGDDLKTVLDTWEPGKKISDDDNFYISRIKPKTRFRNIATQVNQGLTEANDKKLLFWVPINTPETNAFPNGIFDSEVFPMWNYITHYGNWSAGFIRMPGNFMDVAHKNGVGVSVTAGIPHPTISSHWQSNLNKMIEVGPQKMADLLLYYGIDGLGYNSEFYTNATFAASLRDYHGSLYSIMTNSGKAPLYEMIWYDGTNDNGGITFDGGLDSHNSKTFGAGSNPVSTSLFLNYNWNSSSLLNRSITNANNMERNSLDLYAGVNMQGGQPGSNNWPLLKDYPISIGLWGAHSQNMFFESRGEKGSLPEVQQRTYMHRVERYFSGGTRNPINSPAINTSMKYNADNYSFFGMSKMMSARSALSWDLAEEPFISYFNLGNGKFFNWKGERANNNEWYNIGIQDHLPTWRWWFANQFLGRESNDVSNNGLDAEFTWDDAWFGGSLLRIFGTSTKEFLHLFKTNFRLRANDVITIRYKVMSGKTDMSLALSAVGAEETLLADGYLNVIESDEIQIGEWIEKQFTIRGAGLASMNAKDLAMVALRFNNAENLNLHLGEFSIVRGSYEAPQKPIIESTTLLAANHKGVDGKIIFNMPNDKPLTETCYNIDVNTSLFKLYAQQMEQEPILMSSTTSWAGLYFSVPFGFENNRKIRFGVSAMSLDMNHESEISWSEYLDVEDYVISDDIELNKNTIKPNEGFTVSYVDPQHELGKFEIIDKAGNIIKSVEDVIKLELEDGNAIEEIGAYTLRVTGKVADANGNRVDQTRSYSSYIQVTPLSLGALPRITTLTANDEESDIKTSISTPISLKYTGIQADGESSQGLDLGEKAFGFSASEMEMQPYQSFSIAFWAKINQISTSAPAHFVNIRDKTEGWPKNNWGWTWCNIANNGTLSVTFRGSDATSNNALHYRFANTKIETGPWAHYVYVYEYNNAQQIKFSLYINGERQEVTSWKRNQGNETSGEAPFQGNLYPMRGANMVAIGGTAADRSGLDGIIDNFQYWNKALTAEEVLTTMDSYDEIPQDLYGYWDFEESANASGEFENSGIKKNVVGIYHTYIDSDGEGQGNVSTETGITYKPGSPFVKGTVYKVTTVPTWSVDKGNISETKGNDMEGSANVQFAKPGVYTATLTLQNGWGSDSKTFQYITVGDTGIEDQNLEASLSAYPNPFINEVNVCFSNAGEYTIRIYNLEGIVIAEKTQQVEANEIIRININADAGAYIGQILSNNKLIQAVKLIKQ